MKKNKKSLNLKNLETQISKGFNKTHKNHEELARMVGNGFISVQNQINFIKSDISGLKSDVVDIKLNLVGLKDGQEQIKLRLDNTAHRFEVADLKNRVEKLEHKAGIKQR